MRLLHEIKSILDPTSKVIAPPKSATNADRISSEIIVVSFVFVMLMLNFCHVTNKNGSLATPSVNFEMSLVMFNAVTFEPSK